MHPSLLADVVAFFDKKSVLQCIKNTCRSFTSITTEDLMQTYTRFSCEFNREITIEWGQCHCKIDGTLAADKLVSTKEKPENPVLESTCKQMIKSKMQIKWICG